MKAIITEKPSVAREIATVLGVRKRQEGYLEGNGYKITWAFGHLVELAMPEDYGWTGFKKENLPMIPQKFKLLVRQVKDGKIRKKDSSAEQQLKIIKEIFNEADEIIVATDAGREGELIFRYIYQYLKCKTPFRRLWISSMTNKAILDGFANLKPGSDYDNLHRSALYRSQADWLVGLNASQALSIAAHGSYSLGRVQTPTLKMVCERFLENRDFESRPYWQIRIASIKDGIPFRCISDDRWETEEQATKAMEKIQSQGFLDVENITSKELRQEPPLLYDLTALQKEANTQLDYPAEMTLRIAQSLYEKKVLSYPRTGSRYLPQDVAEQIPSLVHLLTEYSPLASAARETERIIHSTEGLNPKSIDDKKVTDHHALIITENLPQGLSIEEESIYNMVASRMLEAFSQACIKESTHVHLTSAGYGFSLKGNVVRRAGWRSVRNIEEDEPGEDNMDNPTLPSFEPHETLRIESLERIKKQTRPRPLHTESSLLAAMETAGKEIEDEMVRASMQDTGIGTPATRAAIIETLFKREYITRDKKSLLPTPKGLAVYEIVKDKLISNVSMTGQWETELNRIARGEPVHSEFENDIKEFTGKIVNELLGIHSQALNEIARNRSYPTASCPACGGQMRLMSKLARCQNEDCGLAIWKEMWGKTLTEKQFMALVTKGKTPVIKGFTHQSGDKFDAILEVENKKVVYRSVPRD